MEESEILFAIVLLNQNGLQLKRIGCYKRLSIITIECLALANNIPIYFPDIKNIIHHIVIYILF
jgi:hypothetical protein